MRLRILSESSDDPRRRPQYLGSVRTGGEVRVRIRIWNTIYTYTLSVSEPSFNAIEQVKIPNAAFVGLNNIKELAVGDPEVEEIV